jgi:hypothetical protein
MNGETQDGPERNSRGAFWVWLCWLAGILVLYVLSTGPVAMMYDKKLIRPSSPASGVIDILYWPVGYAVMNTPLAKPFRIYWHLWAPEAFDSKGKLK